MQQDHFEEIVEYILENQKKFYRIAYSNVQNEQDAMDVVQNAVCKALEHAADLRDIHALKTWFYRILTNESMSFLRKNRRELLLSEPLDEEACVCDPEYAGREEIAEVTMLNLNTVKAKLYRGLKALRVEMEGMKI